MARELHEDRIVETRRAASAVSRLARSPTTASTGSMGTTRPLTKVMAMSPRKVIATVTTEPAGPASFDRARG
jgi:hypothetical protein